MTQSHVKQWCILGLPEISECVCTPTAQSAGDESVWWGWSVWQERWRPRAVWRCWRILGNDEELDQLQAPTGPRWPTGQNLRERQHMRRTIIYSPHTVITQQGGSHERCVQITFHHQIRNYILHNENDIILMVKAHFP